MYSPELVADALIKDDGALLDVITESLNLPFKNKAKITQDYLFKLVQEKKVSCDLIAENLYRGASSKKDENVLAIM